MKTIEDRMQEILALEGKHIPSVAKKKEVKLLPEVLADQEIVGQVVSGIYNKGIGILVATQRRLVFIDKGLFGLKVEEFPLQKISSIQYELGLLGGKIKIHTSSNVAEISSVETEATKQFVGHVRASLAEPNTPTAPASGSHELVDQLKQLAELKAAGILTEQEFSKQKAKLLS